MTGDRRHAAPNDTCRRGQLAVQQLWFRYMALRGDAHPLDLQGYLIGLMSLDDLQYDILAHALNERLGELGLPRDVPYTRPWPGRPRPGQPGDRSAGPPEPTG